MGQSAKAWTKAIDDLLDDGEWHSIEDALAVGMAQVSEERALQEMGDRQTGQPNERRVEIGKRNVAMQAITGRARFGHYEWGQGRKQVRSLKGGGHSLGELASRVASLEALVTQLIDASASQQAQLDRLDTDETTPSTAQALLNAAGVPSHS